MSSAYSAASETIFPMYPPPSDRRDQPSCVVNEYTEAICALGHAASAARDIRAQLALTSAANRLRGQVEAHRALQAPTVDGPMDLADYVGQLCACLARAPLAENGLWRLRVTADEVWLDASQCWRVGLVIAELVRNAARHGLAGGAGAIWVVVEDLGGRVRCSVCDDGAGAPAARPGRGRRLVQALAAELGGAVAWSFAPNGCCAVLEFDAPQEPRQLEAAAHIAAAQRPIRFR